MDRTERFHLIDQMLSQSRSVTREQFLEALEISPATFKRDLEYLRDRLGAPIIWDASSRGYCYQQQPSSSSKAFHLPGMWFNTGELEALLMMNSWLEQLGQGVLSDPIKPLKARIHALLDRGEYSDTEIISRVRILLRSRKLTDQRVFSPIIQALLAKKRVKIEHHNRSNGQVSSRIVSPQRLTWYRDNWYLDSWCHLRQGIRSFAIDAISKVAIQQDDAQQIASEQLEIELNSGYGIFSGESVAMAELRFSPKVAAWIEKEQWHPNQQGYFDPNGFYILSLPYSQPTELVMDTLRYASDVEVLKPLTLRNLIRDKISEMHRLYD